MLKQSKYSISEAASGAKRLVLFLSLTLGSVALLSACSKTITTDSVEAAIQEGFTQKTSIKLESIDCPSTIEANADRVYECKGTANGKTVTIEVKPTGEEAKFNWKVTKVQ